VLSVQLTDDLYIIGDESCYKLCVVKRTKKVPQGIQDVLGYHPSLVSAIEAALDHKIRTSDFISLSQIKEAIREFEYFIRRELFARTDPGGSLESVGQKKLGDKKSS